MLACATSHVRQFFNPVVQGVPVTTQSLLRPISQQIELKRASKANIFVDFECTTWYHTNM